MQTKSKSVFIKLLWTGCLTIARMEILRQMATRHYIVSFPFIENEYHYDILLSFGDKCECLEPLHIRTEMKRRIQGMTAIYES